MLGTSRIRRAGPITAVVAVTALMGCSAGQVTQTSSGVSSVSGLNTQTDDGSVLIRNLAVSYHGTAGYPAGATAPLELLLFNQTGEPVTVSIGSRPSDANVRADIVSAGSVEVTGAPPDSGGTTAGPVPALPAGGTRTSADTERMSGASAPPTPPPGGVPARFAIEPLGFASFRPGGATALHAVGLTDRLAPGEFLSLVFEFGNGVTPLRVHAPMAIPTSPAARAPGDPVGHHAGEPSRPAR
jgi:hypothetical protein